MLDNTLPSSSIRQLEKQHATLPSNPPLSQVPNIKYFCDQEIHVENLPELGQFLRWDLIQAGLDLKWLAYSSHVNNSEQNIGSKYSQLAVIFAGQMAAYLSLQVAENNFDERD